MAILHESSGEELPEDEDGWEVVKARLDGHPSIAIRRRRHSLKREHITDILVIYKGEAAPTGFEVLYHSSSGQYLGDINLQGTPCMLALRKSVFKESDFLVGGAPTIDHITFVSPPHGDEEPEDYHIVTKNLYPRHSPPETVYLAYHVWTSVSLSDLSYGAATLDRFPRKDHKNLELPVNELPMFAYPQDLRINYRPKGEFPLPGFFSFVFTNAIGENLYVACLRFWEIARKPDLQPAFDSVYNTCETHPRIEFALGEGMEFFAPKIICVVSKQPFYRAMRRYLRQIYCLSLSTIFCPIEFFVALVVNEIPLPVPGGRPFHVHLDAALISETSKMMAPIVFDLHDPFFLPFVDLNFSAPLRCLSIDNILVLYCLILQESKLIFTCSSDTLLTEVMETMRSLIFPLSWSSCFISRLPESLLGILDAPGGLMVGVQLHGESHFGQALSRVGSQGHAGSKQVRTPTFWERHVPQGAYVVDLTTNTIYLHSGSIAPLPKHKLDALANMLPQGPRRRLHDALQRIVELYHLGPSHKVSLEQFDSAFELEGMTSPQDTEKITSNRDFNEFPTLLVRDAFIAFMIDLLGDYTRYIIPPVLNLNIDLYRTFKEQFAVRNYLGDADRHVRPLLEKMTETQMFASLLQQRAEQLSFPLAFFEAAALCVRDMGLSAGGHKKEMGAWVSMKGLKLPIPIHKLVGYRRSSQVMHSNCDLDTPGGAKAAVESSSPLRSGFNMHKAKGSVELLARTIALIKLSEDDSLTNSSPAPSVSNSSLDGGGVEEPLDRREMDHTESDLCLHDASLGPLLLPGPTRNGLRRNAKALTKVPGMKGCLHVSSDSVLFKYNQGWPMLSDDCLALAADSVHWRMASLRATRQCSTTSELEIIHSLTRKDTGMIPRPFLSPTPALSSGGRQHNNNTASLQREILAARTLVETSRVAIQMVLELFSLSFVTLGLRCVHRVQPIDDLLQMLGLTCQLESLGLLSHAGEAIWRSLFAACAAHGGNFTRSSSCAVFETMRLSNQTPDVLTYGHYLRAYSAATCKGAKPTGDLSRKEARAGGPDAPSGHPVERIVDPFGYLEEMGLTWVMQRALSIQRSALSGAGSIAMSSTSASVQGGGAGTGGAGGGEGIFGGWMSRLGGGKRAHVPVGGNAGGPTTLASAPAPANIDTAQLTAQISQKLGLSQLSGVLTLHTLPGGIVAAYPHICSGKELESAVEQAKNEHRKDPSMLKHLETNAQGVGSGAKDFCGPFGRFRPSCEFVENFEDVPKDIYTRYTSEVELRAPDRWSPFRSHSSPLHQPAQKVPSVDRTSDHQGSGSLKGKQQAPQRSGSIFSAFSSKPSELHSPTNSGHHQNVLAGLDTSDLAVIARLSETEWASSDGGGDSPSTCIGSRSDSLDPVINLDSESESNSPRGLSLTPSALESMLNAETVAEVGEEAEEEIGKGDMEATATAATAATAESEGTWGDREGEGVVSGSVEGGERKTGILTNNLSALSIEKGGGAMHEGQKQEPSGTDVGAGDSSVSTTAVASASAGAVGLSQSPFHTPDRPNTDGNSDHDHNHDGNGDDDDDDDDDDEEDDHEDLTGGARRAVRSLRAMKEFYARRLCAPKQILEMCALTTCSECGYAMMEEEVHAAWYACGLSESAGAFAASSSQSALVASIGASAPLTAAKKASDYAKSHWRSEGRGGRELRTSTVHCVNCHAPITPMLRVSCCKLRAAEDSNKKRGSLSTAVSAFLWSSASGASAGTVGESGDVPAVVECWNETVPLLPASHLRMSVEQDLNMFGFVVLNAYWLHSCRPAVYWAMQWYASRLGLPLGIIPHNSAARDAPEAQWSRDGFPLQRNLVQGKQQQQLSQSAKASGKRRSWSFWGGASAADKAADEAEGAAPHSVPDVPHHRSASMSDAHLFTGAGASIDTSAASAAAGIDGGMFSGSSSNGSSGSSGSSGSTSSSAHQQTRGPGPWDGSVCIGWRESVVRARTRHLLLQIRGGQAPKTQLKDSELGLSDVFPTISAADLEELDLNEIRTHLAAGTPEGLKSVLCSLMQGKAAGIFVPLRHESEYNKVAGLYQTLLSLLQVFGIRQQQEISKLSPNDLIELSKGESLDKLYTEVVNEHLSDADLEMLSCSREDLQATMPSPLSRALRCAIGFCL
jgi:hypothetical protein